MARGRTTKAQGRSTKIISMIKWSQWLRVMLPVRVAEYVLPAQVLDGLEGGLAQQGFTRGPRKVDLRLPGKGNGARPVYEKHLDG